MDIWAALIGLRGLLIAKENNNYKNKKQQKNGNIKLGGSWSVGAIGTWREVMVDEYNNKCIV